MQSMVSVTLAFGSRGADMSAFEPLPDPLLSSLLLVPQAASEVRVSTAATAAAEVRRVGRNQELLIGGPLRA
jgi:hypothetical protein